MLIVVVDQESLRLVLRVVLRVLRLPCVLGFLWVGSRGDIPSCTNADAGRSCI